MNRTIIAIVVVLCLLVFGGIGTCSYLSNRTTKPVVEAPPPIQSAPVQEAQYKAPPKPELTAAQKRANAIAGLESLYPATEAPTTICEFQEKFEKWDTFVSSLMEAEDISAEDLHPDTSESKPNPPALTTDSVIKGYRAATLGYLKALQALPLIGAPDTEDCKAGGDGGFKPGDPSAITGEILYVLSRSRISFAIAGVSLDKLRERDIQAIKALLAKRRAGVKNGDEVVPYITNDYAIRTLMENQYVVRDDVGMTVDEETPIREANSKP